MKNELKKLRDNSVTTLDVYWLEENDDGDGLWWCDVINDDLCWGCKTAWNWTVMSRAEYNIDSTRGVNDDEDWFIVADGEYSDDLVRRTIQDWLQHRGFVFDVVVVQSAGSVAEKRILNMIDNESEVKE